MSRYEQVITRPPSRTFANGLTHGLLGKPDVDLAIRQHEGYIEALRSCGVKVINLQADDRFPDSCFTEDEAIVTDRFAVLTKFREPGRQGEDELIRPDLEAIYGSRIERITRGTLEGGDIIRDEDHFFIGLSRRTNEEGAQELAEIVSRYGYSSTIVDIRPYKSILHLTTAMSCIGDHTLVTRPELGKCAAFDGYRRIITTPEESYAGNTVRMNDFVLVPAGFDDTITKIEDAGYKVIPVAVSEIEKMDGGLSCLSLRLPKLNF